MCTLLWFAGSSSRKFTDHITTAITQLADLMQKPDWMVINVMSVHPGSLTTDSSELQGMFVIWMSSTLYWLVFVHRTLNHLPTGLVVVVLRTLLNTHTYTHTCTIHLMHMSLHRNIQTNTPC